MQSQKQGCQCDQPTCVSPLKDDHITSNFEKLKDEYKSSPNFSDVYALWKYNKTCEVHNYNF